jgi:Glucose dehydrogenase
VVCCGVSNKGAAIYDGKIFRTTLDAHVIAYDAKDGKDCGSRRSLSGRMAFR